MPDTIVYFKNGLGNFLMMTPAIQALASMEESGKVDVCLASEWNDSRRAAIENICLHWELINRVIDYPRETLPEHYTRWFITAHGENSDAAEIFRNKIRNTNPRHDWKGSGIHEIEYYMQHVRGLGYSGGTPWKKMPLAPGPALEGKRPYIGLCNGRFKDAMWDKKEWPYFKELADTARRYFDATIIGVGQTGELNGVALDIDYTGALEITETAKVISQLDILITTDTGNMHIADALHTPMVALFGGTLLSKNAPLSDKARIMTAGLTCQPCQGTNRFGTCNNYQCMKMLTVGDVMNEMRAELR